VVKFVLIADVLHSDGERYIITDISDNTPPWDIAALLDHMRQSMQAVHTAVALEARQGGEDA